jgi:predicted TIM-barrel fold metal-dependent hydrolase
MNSEKEPPRPLRLDGHVHFVGDGSDGSGCWLKLDGWMRRIQGRLLLSAAGLPSNRLDDGLDLAFEARLTALLRTSGLDGLLLLAQDEAYRNDGSKIENFGSFHVPNSHIYRVCRRNPGLFPACSIHPARPDALDELELALNKGCRVLKLLPNCLNVDCSERRFIPFWKRMAAGGMVLLAHTGGEFTLPQTNPEFADPRRLCLPLEQGVTVIAAHAAGRSGIWDPDWTAQLESMAKSFPSLYCDNSALCSPNRWRTIAALLDGPLRDRVIHGSDYPVPTGGFGPWIGGHLSCEAWRASAGLRNPFARDAFLKESIGFAPETFTRLDKLTGLTAAWLRQN